MRAFENPLFEKFVKLLKKTVIENFEKINKLLIKKFDFK
jgi:hypothetical protein